MTAKHTKGPWKWYGNMLDSESVRHHGDCTILQLGDDGASYGMHAPTLERNINSEEAAANDLLIESSPDMFEALEDLIDEYDRCEDLRDLDFDDARAALSKAKGETK